MIYVIIYIYIYIYIFFFFCTCRFYCTHCEIGFDYQSKYEAHLKSKSHSLFADSLTSFSVPDADDRDGVGASGEECMSLNDEVSGVGEVN